MLPLLKFIHLACAVLWLGGIAFMLFAMRPAAVQALAPPQRMALFVGALRRFFWIVRVAIVLLLATGLTMLLAVGFRNAPIGWHLMFGIGLVMFALFGHLEAGPFKRLKAAVAVSDWPAAGVQAGRIPRTAMAIFVLGWIAIAAMRFIP